MKTLATIILLLFCSGIHTFAQNRIKDWKIEKITSIEIDRKSTNTETRTTRITNKQDMDKVFAFLRNVDFIELNDSSIKMEEHPEDWNYKIIFRGQQDQVVLFNHFAFIGKTTFLIDDQVIKDLDLLLKEL